MKAFLRLGLAALLFLPPGAAQGGREFGGRFPFKTYGPEQGFPDAGLTCVAQDSDGFIWIGGDTGLTRYDGSTFHKFTSRDGLPSTSVTCLLRRRGGGLWVGTEGGLARYAKGVFTPVCVGGRPFQPPRRAPMALDSEGSLWAMDAGGLYRQSGDDLVRVDGLPRGVGRALAFRPSTGSAFLAVGGRVWERSKDGTWTGFSREDGLPEEGIAFLAVDGENRLWVAGSRLLRYQDPDERAFRDASAWLPAHPFSSGLIGREPDGTVDLPTNSGLLRLKGDEHDVLDASSGMPSKWVAASLRDREGNLWVLGAGLHRQLGLGLARSFTSQDGLPSDLVWSVLRDRSGRLFAGTSEGVAILGPSGFRILPGTEGLNVTSMAQDATGRLLIGSNSSRMRTLEPGAKVAGDAFIRSFRPQGCPPMECAESVLAARDGSLWAADPSRGLFRLDPVRRTYRLEYGPAQAGVPDLLVWQVVEDAQGRIWSATSTGLLVRDASGWHRFGPADGLKAAPMTGLVLVRDGAWVLYREPKGLSKVAFRDGKLQVLTSLDMASGLGSNTIFAGAEGRDGTLWLGTDRGVVRVRGREICQVSRGTGLVGDDCSQAGLLVEPSGDVWVGTTTGLARLRGNCRPNPLVPLEVVVSQVNRGRVEIQAPLPHLDPVAHRDATLEFRFSAPTYMNEKAVRYQVRLAGLEEDWRVTDIPAARYAALPGGSYQFLVRAAYPGMPWGPVTVCGFEVLPPWWRSWWFLSLEVLAGGSALTGFVHWRLRKLARQKERLARIVERATGDLLKANQALEKANLALKAQSLSDPLTGLHNRRFLSVVVDDDTAKVQRSYRDWTVGQPLPNNDLVFLMVDLDHFKDVNDAHGHAVGDRVLEQAADALRKAARETDAVIRWGGEEFLVMARNSTRAEATAMAERIRGIMAEREVRLDSGEVLRWTCSVGFASFPFSLGDVTWLGWERVVEIADASLYMAKRAGRNCWVGTEAGPALQRARHGPRLPWELAALAREGAVILSSNRPEGLQEAPEVGEVLG
jgi:diguanylate cyclase (GGDEF)-like protein